jgi:hypothetical protein
MLPGVSNPGDWRTCGCALKVCPKPRGSSNSQSRFDQSLRARRFTVADIHRRVMALAPIFVIPKSESHPVGKSMGTAHSTVREFLRRFKRSSPPSPDLESTNDSHSRRSCCRRQAGQSVSRDRSYWSRKLSRLIRHPCLWRQQTAHRCLSRSPG